MNKNVLIPSVVVFVVLIGGAGVVALHTLREQHITSAASPSPSPASQSQVSLPPTVPASYHVPGSLQSSLTYKNPKIGFSFTYSSDLSVVNETMYTNTSDWGGIIKGLSSDQVQVTSLTQNIYKDQQEHFPEIIVSAYKTNLSARDWLKLNGVATSLFDYKGKQQFLFYGVQSIKTTTVAGHAAVSFTSATTSDGGKKMLVSNGKGVVLEISNIETGVGTIPDHYYQEILSSLSFFE